MANVLDALKKLKERQTAASPRQPIGNDRDTFLQLTVSEFGSQSVAILVRSFLLGEEIMLVSNQDCLSKVGDDYVAYLPGELEAISNLSPEMIKRIHWLKRKTNGRIVSDVVTSQVRSQSAKRN
jgi:hypothetical protein